MFIIWCYVIPWRQEGIALYKEKRSKIHHQYKKSITNTTPPPNKKIQIATVPLPSVQQLAVCENGIISQMGLLNQISNTLLEYGKSNLKLENRANVYILNQKNTSIPDFVTNFFINAYQT